MRCNYDIKTRLSERAGTFFLNYILECMTGNRDPIKNMAVTSELNIPGTYISEAKGVIHKETAKTNVTNGELQYSIEVPLGTEGKIKYISLIGGSLDYGTIVETFMIPDIDKLAMVSLDITLILMSYDS